MMEIKVGANSKMIDCLVAKPIKFLDPKLLLTSEKEIFEGAKKYLETFKDLPYIFNLGHGLLPETDPDKVMKLVKFYREYRNAE